jgi:hypothetical protein
LQVALLALAGCTPDDGCMKDVDCKGDRVCISGMCVSPGNEGGIGAQDLGAIDAAVGDRPLGVDASGGADLATADLAGTPRTLSFEIPPSYEEGPIFALGDYDGDGKLDLVTVTQNAVHLLLYQGNAALGAPSTVFVGGVPNDIAAGDLNRDGKTDLIVSNPNGVVGVLLGDGKGGFQQVVTYPGIVATSIKLADMNGDGKLDVALGSPSGVAVLLGNGDGTLQAQISTGTAPIGLFGLGDLNGDGKPDLVLPYLSGNIGNVGVLLGKGDGTFGAPSSFPINTLPATQVALGDPNNDGHLDVVIAVPLGQQDLAFMPGDGTGKLGAPVTLSGATGPNALVADLNGDGKMDLITGPSNTVATGLRVALGSGGGNFAPPTFWAMGIDSTAPQRLAVADVDGDGKLDIVEAPGLCVALGRGDGRFHVPQFVPSRDGGFNSGSVADFDGDGRDDVASIDSGKLLIWRGTGAGFQAPLAFQGVTTGVTRLGDFNGDGHPDLALLGGDSVMLTLNDGKGNFTAGAFQQTGTSARDLAVGDFDGDGQLDVASTDYNSQDLALFLNLGNGKLATARFLPDGIYGDFVAAGDLNGDGFADLVVSNQINGVGSIGLFLSNGKASYGQFQNSAAPQPIGAMRLQDVDGDGKLDLLTGDSQALRIAHGKGDGTFLPAVVLTATAGVSSIALADFDGDGIRDLAGGSNSSFAIFLGDGVGGFGPQNQFQFHQTHADYLHVGDFNGDGLPDLMANRQIGLWFEVVLNTSR